MFKEQDSHDGILCKCPDFQPVQTQFQVCPRSRPVSLRRNVEAGGPCVCVCVEVGGQQGSTVCVCVEVGGQQGSTVCMCVCVCVCVCVEVGGQHGSTVCVCVCVSETFPVGFGESDGDGIGYAGDAAPGLFQGLQSGFGVRSIGGKKEDRVLGTEEAPPHHPRTCLPSIQPGSPLPGP